MTRADPRVSDLVQAGIIRTALFLPQYTRDAATGELHGVGMGFVALEITRALAARLGIEMFVAELPTPPTAVECLKTGSCDVAFLGIEASRAAQIDFSPPIIQFDFTFLLPAGSPIHNIADADQAGVRIAIVRNHASSLALSRIVKHATLSAAELPDTAFDMLRTGSVDALAAPREQLLDYAGKLPSSRVLEDSYGINLVAMAVPKGHVGRLAYVSEFIEEAKKSGMVDRIIERGRLHGFRVAPSQKPQSTTDEVIG